jgi:Tfp pilus assembly protein PilO
MIKLTKAQRDQMIMVVVGTVAVSAALWWFVVNDRDEALIQTRQKSQQIHDKLSKAEELLRHSEQISETLRDQSNKLQQIESGLAPDRDAYGWVILNLNSFVTNWEAQATAQSNVPPNSIINTALPHEVHIVSMGGPPEVSDKGIIPRFPYRWATFHIKGIAYYHDFGRFVADFENAYRYFRIQNLDISPSSGVNAEPEKLSFSFDLVAPVQPAGQEIK